MLIADLILSLVFMVYEFLVTFDGLIREIPWLPERGEDAAQVLSTFAALLLITNFYQTQQYKFSYKTTKIMVIASICLGTGILMRWFYIFNLDVLFIAFITATILFSCLYLFLSTNDYINMKQKSLKKGSKK